MSSINTCGMLLIGIVGLMVLKYELWDKALLKKQLRKIELFHQFVRALYTQPGATFNAEHAAQWTKALLQSARLQDPPPFISEYPPDARLGQVTVLIYGTGMLGVDKGTAVYTVTGRVHLHSTGDEIVVCPMFVQYFQAPGLHIRRVLPLTELGQETYERLEHDGMTWKSVASRATRTTLREQGFEL